MELLVGMAGANAWVTCRISGMDIVVGALECRWDSWIRALGKMGCSNSISARGCMDGVSDTYVWGVDRDALGQVLVLAPL